MIDTVMAPQNTGKTLFEASNVHEVQGRNHYPPLVEAVGFDRRRGFRPWTSGGVARSWTPPAAGGSDPVTRSTSPQPARARTRDVSYEQPHHQSTGAGRGV